MKSTLLPITLATALFAACGSQPAADKPATPQVAPAAAQPTTLEALQALGIKNFANPAPGLFTAGQPTAEQYDALAKAGVKTVVCLRPANEPGSGFEEEKAKALGIQFVRLPVAGADGITVDNAKLLANVLGAANGTPTLVCCASSNRVGALLAMKAFHLDGQSAEAAMALGKAGGMKSLEKDVAGKLQK